MSASCQAIVRGNTVVFVATFFNQDGEPFAPSGAEVRIRYEVATVETFATETMSQDGSEWSAQWDSNPADRGTIEWHCETTGVAPYAAADGQFDLTANAANPQS